MHASFDNHGIIAAAAGNSLGFHGFHHITVNHMGHVGWNLPVMLAAAGGDRGPRGKTNQEQLGMSVVTNINIATASFLTPQLTFQMSFSITCWCVPAICHRYPASDGHRGGDHS